MLWLSVLLVSIIGVKNLEGIEGAETLRRPGLTAAALSLGEFCYVSAIMGPDTFFTLSKSDNLCSYCPGPAGDPETWFEGFLPANPKSY